MTTILLLAMGATWTIRSLQEVLTHPDYWDPRTTGDWFAVWSFSLALALMAPSVILLARSARAGRPVEVLGWVVAGSALLAAVGNTVEDAVGISTFSTLYVIGVLGLLIGLIGLAVALAAQRRLRHAAVAILWALGLGGLTWGLGFLVIVGSIVAVRPPAEVAAAADVDRLSA